MEYSPIVLFAYNRPKHTLETLQALSRNPEASSSRLYVYVDGPAEDATAENRVKVEEVCNIVSDRQWCGEVILVRSSKNKGLAESVIEGVTDVVHRHGRVIVLEDDLICSPAFLGFMNQFLVSYQDEESVISATGYIYPVRGILPEAFFLRGADCWGWATWKRGWDLFEPDGRKLLDRLEHEGLCSDFDFDGSYPYSQMLRDQIAGQNSSWAIRWYASAFLESRLTLYPGRSLIQNIGNDGSGRHSGNSQKWDVDLCDNQPDIAGLECIESTLAREAFIRYFNRSRSRRMRKVKQFLRFWKRS